MQEVDAKTVAQWMLEELNKVHYLYQEVAVVQIMTKFGKPHWYFNQNGGTAIDKSVLKEFKKLTGDDVIWEKGQKLWRKRAAYDQGGRAQD